MAYNAKAERKAQFDKRTADRQAALKPAQLNTQNQPTQEAVNPSLPQPGTDQTKVVRDQNTGRITFLETPDGKFISGPEKSLRNIIQKKSEEAKTPEGAVEATQVARQQQVQELLGQGGVNQPQDLALQQQGGIPLNPVLEAGLGRALPGAVGAAIGGTLGAVGGPVGIAAGAAVGGSVANQFVSGLTGKLKEEQQQKIRVSYDSIPKSQAQINKMIRYVKQGGDPILALNEINRQLSAIDQAEAEIKLSSMEDLSTFLSVDGGDELGRIDNWNTQIRPNIELLFLQAAQNPSGGAETDLLDLEEENI